MPVISLMTNVPTVAQKMASPIAMPTATGRSVRAATGGRRIRQIAQSPNTTGRPN